MTSDWRKFLSGTDIRGNEIELTDEFASKFGYAAALWMARKLDKTPDTLTVAVGRDPRKSGARLSRALIKGLTAADCDVVDCGECGTPALTSFITDSGKADGAIMITGSHFGAGVNGFKLMLKTGSAGSDDMAEMIEQARTLKVPVRLVTNANPMEIYRKKLTDMARERLEDDALKPLLGLHVVIDAGSGMGGFYADLLEELGADTTGSMNLEPDGTFPAHLPDIGSPDAIARLSETVVSTGADMGVMFDADCDRAAIIDQNGRLIAGNRLIALISAIILDKDPGATIVTDSVTSSGLTRFITEWGGVHYRFRRGYRNVIEEARRLNREGIDCPLAIETSGHVAFRDNGFIDDGVYLVTRLVCEAYDRKRFGQTLSSVIDELNEPVEFREIRLRLDTDSPAEAAQEVIEIVLSHTLDNPEWRFAPDSREGVRILFNLDGGVDNAWFQLRMSVHDSSVMVLNAESDVHGGIDYMLAGLEALLDEKCDIDLTPLTYAVK